MNITLATLAPLLVFLQSAPASRPAPPSPDALRKIAALAWLEGHWTGNADDAQWEAVYSSPEGGEVVSASKEIRSGRVAMHELERFHAVGDDVLLTPHPYGKARRPARLVELDEAAKKAVFEDAENDFPRRFTYQRTAPDALAITLTGELRGKAIEHVISFKRRTAP